MKRLIAGLCSLSILGAAPAVLAQYAPAQAVTPQGAPPAAAPAPPPAEVPAPPVTTADSAATSQDAGQWIYTNQYGWIWAPYGDEYVYTPGADTGDPYAYVYYPAAGWRWVVAPWVWGVGPMPYFSSASSWHFHWFRGPAYYGRSPAVPLFRGGFGGGRAFFGGRGGFGGGRGGGGRR